MSADQILSLLLILALFCLSSKEGVHGYKIDSVGIKERREVPRDANYLFGRLRRNKEGYLFSRLRREEDESGHNLLRKDDVGYMFDRLRKNSDEPQRAYMFDRLRRDGPSVQGDAFIHDRLKKNYDFERLQRNGYMFNRMRKSGVDSVDDLEGM
eukprot:TRINITY_DN4890_c0_g1_i1.p1 TRINITY_DN4890_c0_g1~~TRINITY_DN4890_c0_g1_i1.p1  ORF type:complete len:154 (-),score=25.19 TRINITY_DN4890_c0_g1_i1:71-532(-)